MSENKEENRKQENSWSRLIALITALGGFGGLAALITVFHQCKAPSNNAATSTPNQTSPPASQSSETISSKSPTKLVVQASDRDGERYYNNQDQSAKIHFKAIEGQEWSVISPSNDDKWVKDCKVSKEPILPKGLSNLQEDCKPKKLLCPNYNLGALVVIERNEDKTVKKCLASGAEGNFEMEKGQTVYFLMNDNDKDYNDNKGKVTVEIDYAN